VRPVPATLVGIGAQDDAVLHRMCRQAVRERAGNRRLAM
jgi:hypothetical protein